MGDRTRQGVGQQVANPNGASGPFNMHGNKIINLGAGTNPTDATNLGQVQTLDAAVLAAAENYADNGDLNTLATSEAYTDASSAAAIVTAETYTDTQISNAIKGLSQKPNARFAPTGALPAYVISGGGSTMAMVAAVALPLQDGIAPQLHDIFFYDQDTQHAGVDNGLWTITTLGAPGIATVAQRVPQLAVGAGAMGALTAIAEGTTRQGQEWLCYNDEGADVVGTNALVFKNVSIFGSLSGSNPVAVGTAAPGVSTLASRGDHVHAHGNQASDTNMHAAVVAAGASGFMTGADKTKLDGIAAGAAALGVTSTTAARGDGGPWTVPGAYPYTTVATDKRILVDCSAARTIHIDYAAMADAAELEIIAKGTGASGAGTNAVTIDTVNGGTVVGPPGATSINVDQDKRAFKVDKTNTVVREI